MLIATDYFLFYISEKYLQLGKKSVLIWAISFVIKCIRKGIEILVKRLFSFPIIVFNMKLLFILFIRNKKHLLGKVFGSPHTCNWIYLVRNGFSNYVCLKDTYMTLKSIGKILFVSVLRILLICKFLNFTAVFTKKLDFPKFAFSCPCEKGSFSLIHQTHITIHSF